MANPFLELRMRNLFSTPPLVTDDPMQGKITGRPVEPDDWFHHSVGRRNEQMFGDLFKTPPLVTSSVTEPDDEMMRFEPEHYYSDQYDNLLKDMPQYKEPGGWRKALTAIAAGFAGRPLEVNNVLQAPYARKYDAWKNKADAVRPAMLEERQRNQQNRMFAQTSNSQRIAQQRADTSAAAQRAKEATDKEKIEIAKGRAATYDWKAKHPNHTYKTDSDGYIIAIDPQTNTMTYVVDREGTPVKSSTLPDEDKMELQLKNQKELIGARETSQKNLAEYRGTITSRQIRERGEESRKTKTTVPGKAPSSASGAMSPSQLATERINKANAYLAAHPEAKDFVKIEGRNVTIAPASSGGFFSRGPSKADRDAAYNAIYGGAQQTAGNTSPAKPQAAHPIGSQEEAIQYLKDNNKQVNPQTIRLVMDRLAAAREKK